MPVCLLGSALVSAPPSKPPPSCPTAVASSQTVGGSSVRRSTARTAGASFCASEPSTGRFAQYDVERRRRWSLTGWHSIAAAEASQPDRQQTDNSNARAAPTHLQRLDFIHRVPPVPKHRRSIAVRKHPGICEEGILSRPCANALLPSSHTLAPATPSLDARCLNCLREALLETGPSVEQQAAQEAQLRQRTRLPWRKFLVCAVVV